MRISLPLPAGAFYFVRTLVQYIEDPAVDDNMYNRNALPNRGVGWLISTMFFVCSIMVRAQREGGCMRRHHGVFVCSSLLGVPGKQGVALYASLIVCG